MKHTKFYGEVNDVTFVDSEAMTNYIEYCRENGISIYHLTHLSHHEESGSCAGPEQTPEQTPEQESKPEPWPDAYESINEYLVPFVIEEAFTDNDKGNGVVLDDLRAKLERRMEYYHNNAQFIDDPSGLLELLDHKSEWCFKRLKESQDLIIANEERIKRLEAEIANIKNASTKAKSIAGAYDEVGGYCEALIDIILNDAE